MDLAFIYWFICKCNVDVYIITLLLAVLADRDSKTGEINGEKPREILVFLARRVTK